MELAEFFEERKFERYFQETAHLASMSYGLLKIMAHVPEWKITSYIQVITVLLDKFAWKTLTHSSKRIIVFVLKKIWSSTWYNFVVVDSNDEIVISW